MSLTEKESQQPNNLLMFRAALSNSFQDITKCVNEKQFLQIFTMFKSKKKSVVKKLHKIMENDLNNIMDEDLTKLVEDECLVEGMKNLTKLLEESTVPIDVKQWRPPGNVDLHLRSLDADKILKECKSLEIYVNELDAENKNLMEKITKRRGNIQQTHDYTKKLINMQLKVTDLQSNFKREKKSIKKLYENLL